MVTFFSDHKMTVSQYKTTDQTKFILNWPTPKKCMLILVMGLGMHVLWTGWKLLVILHPEFWRFVNADLIRSEIINNIFAMILLAELTFFCWYFRDNAKATTFFSYVSVYCFTFTLCREAYLSGLMSPTMGVTLVVAITIGRFLFGKFLIYSAAALGYGSILMMLQLTIDGKLPYAPIFAAETNAFKLEQLAFWSYSMLLFIVPTLVVGMYLLERLLDDWQQREQLVQLLSMQDSLTQIYNRRAVGQFLDALIEDKSSKPAILPSALILLDLDHFKAINDTYGHAMGDNVLVETAKILSSNVRQGDIVGRYGGEEFIIVLSKIPHAAQATHVAERCRREISELVILHEGRQIPITASFGVVTFESGINMDHLFNLADSALYQAKANGRNQTVTYS